MDGMAKGRTYRVFVCKECTPKNGWKVRGLFNIGFGQCFFCGHVTRDLLESPLLVCESKVKKKKAS